MDRYALRVLDGTRGLVHGHIIVCCHSGTGLAFVIEALRNYDRARTKLCAAPTDTPKDKYALRLPRCPCLWRPAADSRRLPLVACARRKVYPVRPIVGLIGDELSMYEREILASYSDLFIVKVCVLATRRRLRRWLGLALTAVTLLRWYRAPRLACPISCAPAWRRPQ